MRLLLTVVLYGLVVTSAAFANERRDADPHLRPQDDRVAQAVREGSKRSATFKSLVDRIERSQVIVYVAVNPLIKSNLSGMLTWMTQAGGFRYVRASISPELSADQMIATVAHELQHAVEVIEDESVTDEKSLTALYRRIGRPNGAEAPSRWETTAAQQTGYQVRRELVGAATTTIARVESIRS
jgi:predicted transcriptional regulator